MSTRSHSTPPPGGISGDHQPAPEESTISGDRRARITEGAAELIAERGIRALTHRALDTALGLPPGSTSYYFRTRRALIEAIADTITARSRADFEAARFTAPATADPARDIAAWVDRLLHERRSQLIARHALIIEFATDSALREQLSSSLFSRIRAIELFTALGAADPENSADDFIALLEGLVFDRLAGARSALPTGTPTSRAALTRPIEQFLRTTHQGP